jgi:anti-sigma B factor antagonist
MNIVIREHILRVVIVAPQERIDAANAPELRQQLLEMVDSGANNFVLDLSQVPFMDSSGMAVLVSVLKRSRQAGGDVKLVWPKLEAARRILNLTKFDRVFDMADTAEAAVKMF